MKKLLLIFLCILTKEVGASEIENIISNSFQDTEYENILPVNKIILDKEIKINFKKNKVSNEHVSQRGRVIPSTQDIFVEILVNKSNKVSVNYDSIPTRGQKFINAFCVDKDQNIVLVLTLGYGDYSMSEGWFVQFIPNIFKIDVHGSIHKLDDVEYFNNGTNSYFNNRIVDEPNLSNIYPYYTESRILSRAYEVRLCEKTLSEKVIYDKKNNIGLIINKTPLYNSLLEVSKMYLIKGDQVTILDEQTDNTNQKWYFINYKGKKDINMWIKAEAVDVTE